MKLPGFIALFLLLPWLLKAQPGEIPLKPEITHVSIDTAKGNTCIYWTPSPSTDVEKYFIYYELSTPSGPEGVKLDSVNASTFSWCYPFSGSVPRMYSVTALDSARNESLRKPGLHKPMQLALFYDSCNHAMRLSWNSYVGWGIGLSGYRVLRKNQGSDWEVIKGLNKSDTVFFEFNIIENDGYSYFIEAVKNDGLVSRSNTLARSTAVAPPPDELTVENVTLTAPNEVEVVFSYSGTGEVNDFALLRSSNKNSDFIEVSRHENVALPGGTFTDNILSGFNTYYYRVGALNSCGISLRQSNTGVNILLAADTTGNRIRLSWNPYEDWLQGTGGYRLFRRDENGTFSLIASLAPSARSYTDNPLSFAETGLTGKLYYQLIADRADGLFSSTSNELEINITSDIRFLPDAFTPNNDGTNDFFRPQFNFIPGSFLMIILNRSGNEIYRTTDPLEGWNGTAGGGAGVPEGVYVWFIRYTSHNGVKKELKGHVTVFYP
jgi:gliding motility-associated-like protein